MLVNVLKENAGPLAAATSGLSLMGLDSFGVLDTLPKAALIPIVVALFGAVLFFVRRDYGLINDHIAKNTVELAALRVESSKASRELLVEMNRRVTVEEFGRSQDRVHGKMNRIDKRVTILETKMGMHDAAELDDVDEEKAPE